MDSFTMMNAIKEYEEKEKYLDKKLRCIMNLPDEEKKKELENIAGFLICYETLLSSLSEMGKNVGLDDNLLIKASNASLAIYKDWINS